MGEGASKVWKTGTEPASVLREPGVGEGVKRGYCVTGFGKGLVALRTEVTHQVQGGLETLAHCCVRCYVHVLCHPTELCLNS